MAIYHPLPSPPLENAWFLHENAWKNAKSGACKWSDSCVNATV